MSEEDLNLIVKIRAAFESKNSIGCTGCRYCMPCPHGVNIPEVFKLYNNYQLVKPQPIDPVFYQGTIVSAGSGADRCVSCGLYAQHCPQGLIIPELLKRADGELMEDKGSLRQRL
jgi:predicted aldo/keto reductase-like oxidoreductase